MEVAVREAEFGVVAVVVYLPVVFRDDGPGQSVVGVGLNVDGSLDGAVVLHEGDVRAEHPSRVQRRSASG